MPKKKPVVERLCGLTGLSRAELLPEAELDDDLEDFEDDVRAMESYERRHGQGAVVELIDILKGGGIPAEDAWLFVAKEASGRDGLVQALFAQGLWRNVIPEDSPKWQQWLLPALRSRAKRLVGTAGTPEEREMWMRDLLRGVQTTSLFLACQLLDDNACGIEDMQGRIKETVMWRLARVDENEKPLRSIVGAHELFCDLDPTGRGSGPKPDVTKRSPKTKRPPKKKPQT
jgi:hypothetical protein